MSISRHTHVAGRWKNTTLQDIADINPSQPNSSPSDEAIVSFVPMQAVEAMTGKIISNETRPWGQIKKGYSRFQEQDILVAKITPCMENGKVAIARSLIGGVGAGSTEFHVIRPSKALAPSFLMYYFLQERIRRDAKARMTGSAGQLRVPADYIKTIEINLPPLPEQNRIVEAIESYFTRLDAAEAALKRVQKNLKHYRAALLLAAFEGEITREWRETHLHLYRQIPKTSKQQHDEQVTPITHSAPFDLPSGWVWIALGNVTLSMKNGIYKPKQFYANIGTACLRMYNIENGSIVWKDIKRMDLTEDEIREYGLCPGDILVNRVNSRELVGKAAVIPEGFESCVYESKNIRLRLNREQAECRYINYWLLFYSQKYFYLNAQQTVGMASINQDQLSSMPIPRCSLQEQNIVAGTIDNYFSVANMIEKYIKRGIKQLEFLRQSILKRAFEGNLVPQDPNDEPASVLIERIKQERSAIEEKSTKTVPRRHPRRKRK